MKVTISAAGDSSGYYRVAQPVAHVEGVTVEIIPEKQGLPIVVNPRTRRFAGVALDTDVLVLQRPMHYLMPDVIEYVQARGTAVVVELDDDFHTAHTDNLAFKIHHPRVAPKANWHHLGECVKRADLVTVATDALAHRYGSNGRAVVLRNYVSSELLSIRRRGDGTTLGWAGSVVNHPNDLKATRGGVGKALTDNPAWGFHCVGGGDFADVVARQLELSPGTRYTSTPWKTLELHHILMSELDVGIVPLMPLVFNAAKSWLKGLEYAALGIPFVASDLPEYTLLADRYGIGVLAPSKAKTWRRGLNLLMRSPLREDLGRQYRACVRERLTIERNAWRWPEAWQDALNRRRTTTRRETRAKGR